MPRHAAPHPRLTAPPPISVLIPTYGRPEGLAECLQALAQQTLDFFEVVVIDDGSPEPVAVDTMIGNGKWDLRVIRQENAGPAAARNRAAREARGEIIAFTDDDCLPAPGWLEALLHETRQHPDALVGTLTYNGLPGNTLSATSQLILDLVYEHFNACPAEAYFLASNNMACYREHYLQFGGFDSGFSRPGAEDRDFCDRWRAQHRSLRLIPQALLAHRHAQNLPKFLDLHYRYGRGAYLYQAKRRARKSGTMKEDLGFHRSLAGRVIKCLPAQGSPVRQVRLCLGLVLWQLANAAGFLREAMATPKTLHEA